jgi:glyoxylase-like metal-dependent hydrolase (beta-lactamase superfamily II)
MYMSQPKKILEGLYQIEGAVNVFVIDDPDDGVILIDTGLPWSARTIIKAVQAIGHNPRDINHILITHADLDHVGGLTGLVKRSGAEVYAGVESKGYIENRQSPPHMPAMSKPFIWLANKLFSRPTTVHHAVNEGETLPLAGGIRVLAAPGHTPDNMNFFWEPHQVLFAADLLNAMRKQTLDLTLPRITWDTSVAQDSARKVLALEPAYICVGHGPVVDTKANPQQVRNLKKRLSETHST